MLPCTTCQAERHGSPEGKNHCLLMLKLAANLHTFSNSKVTLGLGLDTLFLVSLAASAPPSAPSAPLPLSFRPSPFAWLQTTFKGLVSRLLD